MAAKSVGKQHFRMRSAHGPVLAAVASYHYLTSEQVAKLLYAGKSSLNYARELLQELADNEYLQRLYETKATPVGRAKTVYRLARRGIAYCEAAELLDDYRFRPSERPAGEQFLPHTLAINDVLIAASLLPRQACQVHFDGFRHDIDLRRVAPKVWITHGNKKEEVTVVPDGWMDFRLELGDTRLRFPILLEVDRGTIRVKPLKKKLRALLAFVQGPYQDVFGTRFVTVAFAVDRAAFRSEEAAQHRVAELVRWIEEELREVKLDQLAEVFLASVLPRGFALDPKEFFLSSRWHTPFLPTPVSLLDLPEPVPQPGTAGRSKPASATR